MVGGEHLCIAVSSMKFPPRGRARNGRRIDQTGALVSANASVVVAAFATIASVMIAFVNKRKIDDLHVVVDGRLTQLLAERTRFFKSARLGL
jgi:hypothetical protein